MYIDYRAFNKYMKLETYQLPRIDDLLDRVTHAHYLSIINLIIGYQQVQISPGDELKIAFVLGFSLYEFTVLPFGLQNAPSTFKCLIKHMFSDTIDQCILVYLDDILLFRKTTNGHEKHLYIVFSQLCMQKLQEKCIKYEFRDAQVYYLIHIYSWVW